MTQQPVRIPNLPIGPIVDADGNPTPTEISFRQALISSLQMNFGTEGCVVPSQTAANILLIQNNKVFDPATNTSNFTCQGGTLVYDSTNNNLLVCILASDGTPTFKRVNVT